MNLEQMRFTQKIKQNPHDRGVREDYARWLDEQGRREDASEQRLKARQCERFNPDYDYTKKLAPLGLEVTLYAGGEIVAVHDDLWTFWADPAELQLYLERTPPEEIAIKDLPLAEHQPSDESLQRLWEVVPGGVYKAESLGRNTRIKELSEDCWIIRDREDWWFIAPGQLFRARLLKSDLVPI